MDEIQLRDPLVFPSDEVIKDTVKDSYAAYKQFTAALKEKLPDIEIIWKYYNDGKNWLGKAERKKKTIFWLSCWDGYFKVSFFFTETTVAPIGEDILALTEKTKTVGKLVPLIFKIGDEKVLPQVLKVAAYKYGLK